MRLFLGIELPQTQRESLYKQLIPLIRKYPSFRWTHPDLYHATFQFFGEVEDVEKLKDSIKTTLFDKERFTLYGTGLDMFQTTELVLHMTYRREKKIDEIVHSLETTYPTFVKQREFVFHTCIGRAPRSSKQQFFLLRKILEKTEIDISYPVDALTLYASSKSSEGRKFVKIEEFPLV
ncbi:MAG: RNA 2',3'-cyclic phosphodiesterase [Candidatus Roizmanbacteria bacterium]|nr:RNA 2',3'-cyclic phosphodiesterase [Candidatus Roizmanbacteria bacterium]